MKGWLEGQRGITALAERQLFFIGGAPRSGTTWLQLLLDAHPQISCKGEGLFLKALAEPLDGFVKWRRSMLDTKNKELFRDTGGYLLPEQDDAEMLLGTAVLLALEQQRAGKECLAVGEKTPENVFLFPRLKRLFPEAKFIGLARDPRDMLTSAWHFFAERRSTGDEAAAKTAFIRKAIPSLQDGARKMLALAELDPTSCLIVTYERMRAAPGAVTAQLFRFLGVPDAESIVGDCVARTDFAVLSGGRPTGVADDRAFFRKGVVGDWHRTLTPEMNELILDELGWMFPRFGWEP